MSCVQLQCLNDAEKQFETLLDLCLWWHVHAASPVVCFSAKFHKLQRWKYGVKRLPLRDNWETVAKVGHTCSLVLHFNFCFLQLQQNNKSPSTLPRLAQPFHLWLPGSGAEPDTDGAVSWLEGVSSNRQQLTTLIRTQILVGSSSPIVGVNRLANGKSGASEMWLVMESVSHFIHVN